MEDKTVIITIRDENGNWSEISAPATAICSEAAKKLAEGDEIMLVAMDGMALWSGLSNDQPLTIEDLTGFFG